MGRRDCCLRAWKRRLSRKKGDVDLTKI
ncbi:hypothetical protein LINPERPRIM_LOCUS5104 [Linum perenne]